MQIQVQKKNGAIEAWNNEKIRVAIGKSASRVNVILTEKDVQKVLNYVYGHLNTTSAAVTVESIHGAVEGGLRVVNREVADSYSNYRNYRKDIVEMWEELFQKSKDVLWLGDRENANYNSALNSTKGSLMRGYLTKELMKKFFLLKEELDDPIYLQLFDYIDVLIDGPYVEALHDPEVQYRGSSNQRLMVKEANGLWQVAAV